MSESSDITPMILVMSLMLVAYVLVTLIMIKSLLVLCPPNRVAVIAGRKRVAPDGRILGYRILTGGRTLRIPVIERVAWLDLTPIPLEITVTRTHPHGVLDVRCIANVQVSNREGLLENAAERLLDLNVSDIGRIAEDALEASLIGILDSMTPEDIEDINKHRQKLNQELIEKAEEEIKTIGLELNLLKIRNMNFQQSE